MSISIYEEANEVTMNLKGGGFYLVCEDFWRTFHHSFSACAFFFFFFEVEISPRTLISLLRPGSVHSVSES